MELSTDKLGWDDPKRGQRRPWAIVNKHNTVIFLSLARDEAAMWTWWLGWPGADEIIDKQREGFKAVPVTVTLQPNGGGQCGRSEGAVIHSPPRTPRRLLSRNFSLTRE